MKFVIFFAVAIVAVSGKALTSNNLIMNTEFAKNVEEMKKEFKDVESAMKADRGAAAMNTMEFMTSLDQETRSLILKDSAKTITVIIDTTKPMQDRLNQVAEIAQNTADLWKQAAKIYSEKESTPVTEATPAA